MRGQWSILLEYRFRRKCFSHWSRTHWLHACGAGSKPRSREDILADISQEQLKLAQVVEADEYINSQEENLTQRILDLPIT